MADLRKRKGLSQAEVSAKLNVSRQAISKWEVGDTVPSTSNLKSLAGLYGVSLEYLFGEDEVKVLEEYAEDKAAIVEAPAKEENRSREKFWKSLAILAFLLCGILAVTLVYTKISERPGDGQSSLPVKETNVKEGSIEINPEGGFNLEW